MYVNNLLWVQVSVINVICLAKREMADFDRFVIAFDTCFGEISLVGVFVSECQLRPGLLGIHIV